MEEQTSKYYECEKAFERIKKGVFIHEESKFKKITPALISIEAGLDKGYLKRNRINHQILIKQIDDFEKSKAATLSAHYKEQLKISKYQIEIKKYKELYEEALIRELKLFNQLCEYEKQLEQFKLKI